MLLPALPLSQVIHSVLLPLTWLHTKLRLSIIKCTLGNAPVLSLQLIHESTESAVTYTKFGSVFPQDKRLVPISGIRCSLAEQIYALDEQKLLATI